VWVIKVDIINMCVVSCYSYFNNYFSIFQKKGFQTKRKNGFEKIEKVIFLLKKGHLFLSFFKNFSRLFTFFL